MTEEKKPRADDVVLGGLTPTPQGAAVLGGLEGIRQRLSNAFAGNQKAYLAVCAELAKYPDGDKLLKELAIRRCIAITKDSCDRYFIHRYQLVKHPKFQSLYWHPEMNSPFVLPHLRGQQFQSFLRFEDAKKFATELSTEKEPLLWGVAPWVKANYGWLPDDSKPVEWQNLFDGNPLSENGQVVHRTGKKRLQDLGRLINGDPDQLVHNQSHIRSNHPMYLWLV